MTSQLEHWKLPAHWELASIGNKFVFTRKPRSLRLENYERVPFIPMDRIPSDRLFFSDFALTPPSNIASGTYFEEGDLLVSKITPCFENGKQGIVRNIPGGFGIATTEVIPIKPIEGVSHLPFLAMYLLHRDIRSRLAGRMEGATGRQRLPKVVLEEWTMPFPPLPEQHAIATALSNILAAVEVQDKIVATLKELKAATMAKLFREGIRGEPLKQTEIGEIPESWEVVRLGNIAERITKGSSPNWQGFDYCDEGALFVRSQNVGLGELLLSETVYVPQEFNRKERRSILSPGDVLVNIVGASIGRAAVADARLNGANINQAVAMVRLSPGRCDPVFLAHFLISRAGLDQMHRQKKEIARANLSLEDVGSFLVPIPTPHEQDEIAESLERIARRLRATERQRHVLMCLFSSMLHLLMTGEIRLPGFGRRPNLDSPWFKPEDVWEFVGRLVRKFDPERVILFGSRAWGTPRRDSDVDVLLVMEFEGRPVDMAVRIASECDDRFPMDLIVRRPAEVQRRISMGDPFFKQILRDGLVLHERAA